MWNKKSTTLTRLSSLSAALLLVGQSVEVSAQSIDAGAITIRLVDELLTTSSQITARVEVTGCTGVFPQAVRIDPVTMTVELAYVLSSVDLPTGIECDFSQTHDIPFGPLYLAGDYTLAVYDNSRNPGSEYFNSDDLVGTLDLAIGEVTTFANPETPIDGSTQSGIGVIRGWACDARAVAVSFDDLPPLTLAYGTSREDTRVICGDANNGYGAVFAFGSLGNGSHTMTTWIDGVDYGTVEFEVNGLPDPFVEGLSAEYEVPDFPSEGEMVLIRWSQADQNFIIVEHMQ